MEPEMCVECLDNIATKRIVFATAQGEVIDYILVCDDCAKTPHVFVNNKIEPTGFVR